MFGHLEKCTKCNATKPELDLRFVQVWNVPPDVAKKTLQWFQKKAGGASAELAPVGAQLVTAAEMQTAILEMKAIPEAEKMVAAIEKWKTGIPKMKAKVISQQDFENFLEKSKTHLVFVKNLPEDIEDEGDIKLMAKDIKKATIGTHPTHGRFAMIEATNHEAARACVDVFNIPHSGGVMTAELTTAYQQVPIGNGKTSGAPLLRTSQEDSAHRP